MSVPYPKGGEGGWTCVKDHTVYEKDDYKDIRLHWFGYKLFEEEEGGGAG